MLCEAAYTLVQGMKMSEKKTPSLTSEEMTVFVSSTELEKMRTGRDQYLFISSQTEVQYFSLFLQFCTFPKAKKKKEWGCDFFRTGFNCC